MKFIAIRLMATAILATELLTNLPKASAGNSHITAEASTFQDLQLKTGEPFVQARARIMKFGWKPVWMHQDDNYEYDGAEKQLADRGFLEVDFCSIDAGALCVLYYRKADGCLRLNTRGERISYMHVISWENECSPEKK